MFRTVTTTMLALGALAAAGCSSDRPLLGEDRDQLTVGQCSFFAEGDKVQICHRTGSARNPYNVIRTNIASCGGHSGHVGDYITSTNPADPEYDPTCSGQGCFPEGAPFDNTVECCAGLSPQGGVCHDINECATNNGGCGTGSTCANAAQSGQAPTCTDINECATINGGCATGYSCTNAPVSGDPAICTPPAAVCGDGHLDAGEACDDHNTTNGDGCSATCSLECPSASAPSHQWTFNDGTAHDSAGSADGGLFGGASIVNGELVLDNAATAPNQHVNGQHMKAALPDAVSTKTLVVWARLANLTQRGGSALTIEDRIVDNTGSNHFDAIDYAEQVAGPWMAGSNNFDRTKVGSNGGAPETSTDAVMLAIVYGADNSITIYRNGALYMNPPSYVKGALLSYLGGASDAVLGLRHSQCNNNCWLSGSIDEARIYPTALTACQIEALQPVPSGCPAGSQEFGGSCYALVANGGLTANQKEAACVANYTGHLASVHSAAETQFLSQLVDPLGAGNITALIGGMSGGTGFCQSATGTYAWTDGSPWDFNNWRVNTGEPNGCIVGDSCIQFWPNNPANINGGGQCSGIQGCVGWNDVACDVALPYVCKFAPN